MKRIHLLLAIVLPASAAMLQGCFPAAVGVGAGAVMSATDRRTTGAQVEDEVGVSQGLLDLLLVVGVSRSIRQQSAFPRGKKVSLCMVTPWAFLQRVQLRRTR